MKFSCDEQISGIAELDFYLLSETSNWPIEVTDQNSVSIVFTPEEVSVNAEIEPESISAEYAPRTTAEGEVFENNISMRFITRSESLDQLLDQYKNKPGVCKVKYNSGFQKIFGTNEEPLYLSYRVDDGQKITDNAGTIVAIKGETRKRPVYYAV